VAQKKVYLEVIKPSGSGLSVLLLCAPMGLRIEYTNTLGGIHLQQKQTSLDEIDKKILTRLQMDSRTPLVRIAEDLGIPKSTARYRIKRMEEEKVIEGYHAKVNAAKVGKDYITLTFVRARYGPSYHNKIGKMLAQIPGVCSVYFVFGEYDFVVLTKSSNTNDFLQKLERMTNMTEIERTNTQVVGKTLKEDQTIEIYP